MTAGYTKMTLGFLFLLLGTTTMLTAQVVEWRLANITTATVDPDGGGPATGSATFTLQVHTVSGAAIANVNAISVGFAYQSAFAMGPTDPGCAVVSNPPNIVVSPFFQSAGFSYSIVNQCNALPASSTISTGGQDFDRRVAGTMDGPAVTLTSTWRDMFTVTLWTLGNSQPQGGYVVINSGAGGAPGAFSTYAVADVANNEYIANSLTYLSPLPLGVGLVAGFFNKFEATCNSYGTLLSWATAQEFNSSHFEVQKSNNGMLWENVATVQAAGNSLSERSYLQPDLGGGPAFYRIKQVNGNGQFFYTSIAQVNCPVINTSSLIYPVPARDVLNVLIKSDRAAKTQLMVYEASGKLVRQLDVALVNGNNTFRLNTTGLAAGSYVVRSSNTQINFKKTFTVIH